MKVIKEWRKATEQVAMAFVKKYFKREVYGVDTFWAGDEVGGVFCVQDYFFDVSRMIEALELKATFDELYDYYWMEVEAGMKNKPIRINFENYVKHRIQLGVKND